MTKTFIWNPWNTVVAVFGLWCWVQVFKPAAQGLICAALLLFFAECFYALLRGEIDEEDARMWQMLSKVPVVLCGVGIAVWIIRLAFA